MDTSRESAGVSAFQSKLIEEMKSKTEVK